MPKKMKKKMQNIDEWLESIGLKWRKINNGEAVEKEQNLTDFLRSESGKQFLLERGGKTTAGALLVGIGELHLVDVFKLSRYLNVTPKFQLISSTFYEEIRIKKGYLGEAQQVETIRKKIPLRVRKNYANSPLEMELKCTTTALRILEWSDEELDKLIEGHLLRGVFDSKQLDRVNITSRIFDEVYQIKEEVNDKLHLVEKTFGLRMTAIYNQMEKGEFV